jgi:hypothetical protein
MSRHSARCPNCRHDLQYERIHAGFSDLGYMYCDRDEAVVTWDSYDRRYTSVVGEKHPWVLDDDDRGRGEAALGACPFGGTFSFRNAPRCPRCDGELPDLAVDPTYFVVLGRRLDAAKDRIWRESTS